MEQTRFKKTVEGWEQLTSFQSDAWNSAVHENLNLQIHNSTIAKIFFFAICKDFQTILK